MQSLLLLVTTPGVTFTISDNNLVAESPVPKLFFPFLSFHPLMQKPLCLCDGSNLIEQWLIPPGGGTPYNGLYGEAPPERGTFSFRPQVYKRVRILQVEVYKRVGNRSFSYLVRVFNYNISNKCTYGCISLFVKHYMKMTTRVPFSVFIHKTELQQLQIKLVGFFLHSIRVWSSVNASRSLLCLLHLAVSVLQYSLNTLLGYN